MTQPKPPRKDAARNLRRVMDAAAELFAERGLDATLEGVARRAGVGVATVYRKFPDKEALVEALFVERLSRLTEIAEECLAVPDSWEALARYMELICAEQAGDRGFGDVLISGAFGIERIVRARDSLLPLAIEVLGRAQRDGHARADLAATDLPLLIQAVGSIAAFTRDAATPVWRRHLAVVLDGMRAPGATPLDGPAFTPQEIDAATQRLYPAKR
ncbi:helix-turn-helix domain-containing protein [Actinocorallia sp. A-T 12471]|uniref:TetR/AcrR family transcriptional regulator n=1 Tax=Actinocorallia sp. A-T 12471 TaxID=3089813 RepID=UPI0029CD16A1|nr:helix-turn-helix domain-containing protein [Actinocorallia sp. A-T 12471]MDX6741561.1 helix-turn-helix domain-containing protein [Actinocorallia sp. A-T 12471]